MPTNFLKFWGTRGSCPVSGPEWSKFGGNTPSVEIVCGTDRVLIDAGTGIRPLSHQLKDREIHIFFSHTHLDHIIGLPFFEPLYRKNTNVHLWLPEHTSLPPREQLSHLFTSELFPLHLDEVHAHLEFHTTKIGTAVQRGKIELHFAQAHHPGITHCFKIRTPHKTIGYITDNELGNSEQTLVEFFRGCDVLIHEAQYTDEEYAQKRGWGHSGIKQAVEFVREVGCKRWIVTHHDPSHDDAMLVKMEADASQRLDGLCEVRWAHDGMMVGLD